MALRISLESNHLCPLVAGDARRVARSWNALTTAAGLALATPGFGAETAAAPALTAAPVVVTNYVLVTNVVQVTVTNFVVSTNLGVSPNVPASGTTNSKLPDLSWVPPEDRFDWIQLKSGEWLKGRIKAMQERKLEFDSEEMELQTFDWKNIRQVRSPHINDLLYGERMLVAGPIWITPEQVTVGGPEPRTFPRSELQSITPGGAQERNHWSGKLVLGMSLSSGNTKSVDYNATAGLQRRTPDTRFRLDYLGNISSVNDVQSANNERISAEFDYWLSRRLYVVTPYLEYFSDPFQNIKRRATGNVGLGYDLVDHPNLEWNITAGPAYQYTWFDSVAAGETPNEGAAALVFSSRFDWEITRRIDLLLEYRGQYTRRELGETFHHWVTTLSVDLTKRFELDVSLVWDRTQNPTPQSDGTVPNQNDFHLIVGLGVRF